nr:MAG TPA: hypothetical protein [Caudoviricetes sp.]
MILLGFRLFWFTRGSILGAGFQCFESLQTPII